MREFLKRFEGKAVGINYDEPANPKTAHLTRVEEECFSMTIETPNGTAIHFPMRRY